ncbi:MAG: hypothetical protein EHM39_11980, partial [Chloroflexi bacterium]
MADPLPNKPSFSPYRRWGIALQVVLVLCAVLAVVVMVNYISRDYFLRWHVSSKARIPLSARTVRLLESLTNQVAVTVYYDKEEPFYSTVVDLLTEYRLASHNKLSLRIVDYKRDPGAAQQLKAKYAFLAAPSAKNVIIFDCEGRGVKPVDGNALTKYVLELLPTEKEREFRRKPTTFEGERAFTATLLAVTSPNPLKACFLKGHGEHGIEAVDSDFGYRKFASVLQENYIQPETISLLGTNTVPADCSLLIVAGATAPLSDFELEKIEAYLNQGGRLLALFNVVGNIPTGLEKVLAKWG